MRLALVALLVASVGVMIVQGQTRIDARLLAQLKQVFPGQVTFSDKESDPVPHYKVFASGARGAQTLAGFAFLTTDLQPLERGYDGPIRVLVGMDLKGVLTGVMVVLHNEPYGDFSIDTPGFAAQFKGKNILDQFRVGSDIDAISRATISVTSATRAVRNSARRVARSFLVGDAYTGVVPSAPTTR
jgi:NosR/NirI family nitrous oxide reductase transcriptional regulator